MKAAKVKKAKVEAKAAPKPIKATEKKADALKEENKKTPAKAKKVTPKKVEKVEAVQKHPPKKSQ